ncbi:hypothetical protein BSM4216_3699 [Bacillus smithii]|nr:hypothetical protein BSM4216_3699 [Bacillus smithii]
MSKILKCLMNDQKPTGLSIRTTKLISSFPLLLLTPFRSK